jgi:hypothetical protein
MRDSDRCVSSPKPRIFFWRGQWRVSYGQMIMSANTVRAVWLRFVFAMLPQNG